MALVLPVKGDKILTKDDSAPAIVSSFTNLKDEPAVYLMAGSSREKFIFFSDIVEINGVRVEYQTDSKIFDSLGPLKRKFNIPQPKDIIKVKLIEADYRDDVEEIPVASIKLQSKKHGISRGLLICGTESCFSITDIIGVERKEGSEKFDADKFQHYYLDYCPLHP
jgi:hypothetical protein